MIHKYFDNVYNSGVDPGIFDRGGGGGAKGFPENVKKKDNFWK